MPYFYMADNHDLPNGLMVRIWKERRGRRYYHFLYHDVLFLVINADDPLPVQMSEDQVAYFEEVLKENPPPGGPFCSCETRLGGWTRPTATQTASRVPHDHRCSRFDALRRGRNYTLFAGAYTQRLSGAA